jgi:branched-chain amino acid transport system permease protein
VLLGTTILVTINEVTRYDIGGIKVPNEARFLIYGILIILLMRFRPQGLLPHRPRKADVSEDDLKEIRRTPTELFSFDESPTEES